MSSKHVGFSFQGDVLGGTSLIHAATGRLLKALSDGGVDFYAVAATVQLGKAIPIKPEQEVAVTRLLAQRGGSRAGFIANALRIGWGHSDVAVELARTRAGASALLTIGALATGTTNFVAARGLSELMILNGCEPDSLPTIDALKSMIAYLAPFMTNSGFSKVFEHIVSSSTRFYYARGLEAPLGLNTTGEAPDWARAVRHLISTMSRDETAYFCVEQRVAWLATYATHILGMATRIVVGSAIVWESAGSQGTAIFQLDMTGLPEARPRMEGELELTHKTLDPKTDPKEIQFIDIPSTKEGRIPMDIYYPLTEALNIELSLDTRINKQLRVSIQTAILRLSKFILGKSCFTRGGVFNPTTKELDSMCYPINGNFPYQHRETLLFSVCQQLGIDESIISTFQLKRPYPILTSRNFCYKIMRNSKRYRGLEWLTEDDVVLLQDLCGSFEHDHNDNWNCVCKRTSDLIEGFVAAATALMQCTFDPLSLRVCSRVFSGQFFTQWYKIMQDIRFTSTVVYHHEFMTYLSCLFHGQDSINFDAHDRRLLAISSGSTSIYFRAILDEEWFDSTGRTLAITSGRISLQKTLRNLVLSNVRRDPPKKLISKTASSNTYLPGIQIKPHYAKGKIDVTMKAELLETYISFSCGIVSKLGQICPVDIPQCVENFLSSAVAADCQHDHDRPFQVQEDSGLVTVSTFLAPLECVRGTQFYVLSKSSMEQMLQMSFLPFETGCLQGNACLECAASEQRRSFGWEVWSDEKSPHTHMHIVMT